MGEVIRDRAGELVGVDLSPKMIEAAKRKNMYNRLAAGDLIDCLAMETAPFDLILAADVFVYLPDLNPVFKAASEKLSASGLVAFTVEARSCGIRSVSRMVSRIFAARPRAQGWKS
jgi:predicted TPR repeat methyltransferase